jgi:hypothetical protein
MHPRVLDELSSHRFQWASNRLYRKVLGIDSNGPGVADLKKLGEWMYGTEDSTLATWRETLSTKDGAAKKVPWVKRERLIALYVIFAGIVQDDKSRMVKLQPRFDMVEKCKLTYLISDQDHVVPNTYWEGFAEELEQDPDQEHLYHKVVQAKHSTTPASMNNWPRFSIPEQEAREQGEQSHSGQARPEARGIPNTEITTNVEENTQQASNSHAAFILGQQSLLPAEDDSQHPAASLQGRVRQLEDKNAELQRYIDWVHGQFPQVGYFAQALRRNAHNNHEHEAGE